MKWIRDYDYLPLLIGVIIGVILSLVSSNKHLCRLKRGGAKPSIIFKYNKEEMKLQLLALAVAIVGFIITFLIQKYLGYYVLENGVPILHHL